MFRVKFILPIFGLIFGGLFAACSLLNSSTTKKAAPDELFFVQKYNEDTKTLTRGFMDKTGKIVLGPWESFEWNGKKYGGDSFKSSFFAVFPFIESLAGICFYDETSLNVYNEAKADLEKGKCGFIDKTGKIAIEPKYKKISYFSEGLAAISEDGAKFGYIDKSGKQIIEQKFSSKSAFSDGLAIAVEGLSSLKGYIDKTGKSVIEPKFQFATNFGDGHAIVTNLSGKKVIIDKTGKEIKTIETESAGNTDYYYQTLIKSRFYDGYTVEEYLEQMPGFGEGLAMTYDRGKSLPIGYTNTKGELEIRLDPKLVGQIRPFSEGFAPIGWEVQDREKLIGVLGADAVKDFYDWTYVDRKGNVKVPLNDTFQEARPFSEGMAAVKPRPNDKGNWGFINTEFKLTIPACFERVNDFRAGLASVYVVEYANEKRDCEKYYQGTGVGARDIYIDKAGNVVKPQW